MQQQQQAPRPPHGPDPWTAFLQLVPTVERYARWVFRFTHCPHLRADRVQETVALAWRRYLRLAERGQLPVSCPWTWARRCALAVLAGRRAAGGKHPPRDCEASGTARRPLQLGTLPREMHEQLVDHGRGTVPELVAFRLDWPSWRSTRTARDRDAMDRLGRGDKAKTVAAALGVTAPRVTQLRREWAEDWAAFCGEGD